MAAQVIRIGMHTPYEARMRRPHEPHPDGRPVTGSASVIVLPVVRIERTTKAKHRRRAGSRVVVTPPPSCAS